MMRAFGSAKRRSLAPAASSSEPHRGRLPDAQRRHLGADELHRVVDRHARRHHAARRVDVHRDFFFRVFRFKKKKLRDHQRRHAVVDAAGDENDPLFQQAREDVVCALAAVGLLDHHRNEIHVGSDRIAHRMTCVVCSPARAGPALI
jgi:hypothetical protein